MEENIAGKLTDHWRDLPIRCPCRPFHAWQAEAPAGRQPTEGLHASSATSQRQVKHAVYPEIEYTKSTAGNHARTCVDEGDSAIPFRLNDPAEPVVSALVLLDHDHAVSRAHEQLGQQRTAHSSSLQLAGNRHVQRRQRVRES